MASKNRMRKVGIFILIVFQMCATIGVAEDKIVSSLIVEFQQGKLVLHAQRSPLGKILDGIRHECLVEISGLELRVNEPITFSCKEETLADVLKRLLRHLGEKNYAFEFYNERLRRVSVVPEAKSDPSSSPFQINKELTEKKFVDVARVQSTADGSQAQTLDLWEGDLIIEYDGVKITRGPLELVEEMKKKSHKDQVEIIVVRDLEPMRFFSSGGMIYMDIKTKRISKKELNNYYLKE
jgi:C-terminal processing protease CtpA/Prc